MPETGTRCDRESVEASNFPKMVVATDDLIGNLLCSGVMRYRLNLSVIVIVRMAVIWGVWVGLLFKSGGITYFSFTAVILVVAYTAVEYYAYVISMKAALREVRICLANTASDEMIELLSNAETLEAMEILEGMAIDAANAKARRSEEEIRDEPS